VKLFVFDILSVKGIELPNRTLMQRLAWLATVKKEMRSHLICFLPWVSGSKDKHDLYRQIIEQGGEGVVLKHLYASYLEGGQPSNNWYKAKKSATFDCVVMGFTK
jgi:ATP-dependent DNA ligase